MYVYGFYYNGNNLTSNRSIKIFKEFIPIAMHCIMKYFRLLYNYFSYASL